jgi:two-component system LytT family response regulator
MKQLRVILVDDEPRGLNSLEKLLQLNCPEVITLASCTNSDIAMEKIKVLAPDLVFLDIAMPVKNGFEMLKELGEINFEVIFVTAHNQFMIEAFHYSAIDYLLKPIDDDLLIEAVKRARKRIEEKTGGKNIEAFLHNVQQRQQGAQMKLCIPSLKGFQVVMLEEISHAEAAGNYTNFYFLDDRCICSSRPLHEYEELLNDTSFTRIHKSCLVNLAHVKEYLKGEGGTVVLTNGKELEVSRRKKEAFIIKMKAQYKF